MQDLGENPRANKGIKSSDIRKFSTFPRFLKRGHFFYLKTIPKPSFRHKKTLSPQGGGKGAVLVRHFHN
ncbi:MAG: hypothetical protein BGO07_02665 [Alphaproteobacteria bacterium 40-19]|nr:MAG: hypothetical protein BGO07_02665 [Alphaproteobacteria bacterium 40-19]